MTVPTVRREDLRPDYSEVKALRKTLRQTNTGRPPGRRKPGRPRKELPLPQPGKSVLDALQKPQAQVVAVSPRAVEEAIQEAAMVLIHEGINPLRDEVEHTKRELKSLANLGNRVHRIESGLASQVVKALSSLEPSVIHRVAKALEDGLSMRVTQRVAELNSSTQSRQRVLPLPCERP